jgi:hypothetical protein
MQYVDVDKLSIVNEMAQFDRKNRKFYDELTDDERKKFSNYLMIRWGSCVLGSRDMQEYYLLSTNQKLNKHFFTINKHPKLQWLCATTVSPDLGAQRHQWLALKKKEAGVAGMKKKLTEFFPHLKDDEIELLAKITTDKELKQYEKLHGED